MPEENEKVPFSTTSSLLIHKVDPIESVRFERGYLNPCKVMPETNSETDKKET